MRCTSPISRSGSPATAVDVMVLPTRVRPRLLGIALLGLACGEPQGASPESTPLPAANAAAAPRRAISMPSDTIFADTLTLDVGQVRAWNLAAGRYQLSVNPQPRTDVPSALELGAEGVRCAPDRLNKAMIHCLLREPTRLLLKHNGVRTGTERAHVTIVQVPQ
jgi:hypothetical protein